MDLTILPWMMFNAMAMKEDFLNATSTQITIVVGLNKLESLVAQVMAMVDRLRSSPLMIKNGE